VIPNKSKEKKREKLVFRGEGGKVCINSNGRQ